jgi:hypothetical protein
MRIFFKYEFIEQIKNLTTLSNALNKEIQSCYEKCFKNTSCYSIIYSTNDCLQMSLTELNDSECEDKICVLMNRKETLIL